MSQTTLSGKSYLDQFDTKAYLKAFCSTFEGNASEKGATYFHRKQIHDFYTRYSAKWDSKSARLLEFGGGAVITSLIGAAPHVNQITFAAYAESERQEIELWKDGKEGAHDWSSHFKYIVNVVEQIAGDDAWRRREELLRSRITAIIACDIFCDNPLLSKQEPFELVSTNLCLEAACATFGEYKEAIKKLAGLLKPGGFLVMLIVERETFYLFGGKKWFCLYLTQEQVQEALTEAGMAILVMERDPAPMDQIQNPTVSDYKALVFVAAQKVVF